MTALPLQKFGKAYLKREDQNLTGSVKDRALPAQIESLERQGFKKAVISSSGNAAISAIHFCQQKNINLDIFLSTKIDPKKRRKIEELAQNTHFTKTPIKEAFRFSKKENAYLLRQSTDPSALKGYQDLGKELCDQLPQISSIFFPVGSGTTLLGTYRGISESRSGTIKFFAVQPASHAPIASIFDPNIKKEEKTSTDALSVKFLPLKEKVIKAISETNGDALVISEKKLQKARLILEKNDIFTSFEGALAYAGYKKAKSLKIKLGPNPVVILTGQKHQ